ncbi:LacI family DNA-binding transcriptional regulator [Paenibacillus crassostreae]|uniref:LacI family transcriptional regulator n=1 Tax=Paenibacillus crassostreae TaxID=1763538 RepID=A0A167B6Y3_9BACL|nr:LacI family DNA-binding transcriptional regulator [Paenibacillus crassostreae]AOZ93119.1 LacI family transcriptional regulator [Paenibacillus crassostreae]OAB71792.1 LacI family transcriptional regulator [Paenibacillus crassostreae]
MAKKITMQQIADHLGVSKFVVSKALSGKGGVNEDTKERVIQAASQLGYFSQKNAYVKKPDRKIAYANGKQSVIVLMPNIRSQTRESLYWGRIMEGISMQLEEEGLGMVIISEQSVDSFLDILNPNGILGLIGVGQISTPLLLEIHRIGLPIVLVDHEDPLIPSDTIFVNNVDAMARLANHLMETGHQQLQFIGNNRFSRSFRDRFIGFRSAIEERGLELQAIGEAMENLVGVENNEFAGEIRSWLINLKKSRTMPTVLVCANDFIARTTMKSLIELGIDVPGEVSVTGFDNIDVGYSDIPLPTLTTVHVPKEAMGRRAVEKLLERLAKVNEPMEKILLSGDIVFRDSTTAARVQ